MTHPSHQSNVYASDTRHSKKPDDFVGYYYISISVLADVSQAIRHAEVFFDPQAHDYNAQRKSIDGRRLQSGADEG
ncbi:hypothetical protein F4779DRAFT_619787 [Xylariaceae sp. FL0662B]|nr:hypothetical protein F4779DRAFT_619787 [Xylariaceae sp. FL0662B]